MRRLLFITYVFFFLCLQFTAPRRVHKLAILAGPENYEGIRDGLGTLREHLRDLQANGLMLPSGKLLRVTLYWGSDMKFLHIVRGLKSCKANFPCAWCAVHREQLGNFTCVWLTDEARITAHDRNNEDLFAWIPMRRTVPDLLHALLRHWDLFFELFICELWETGQSLELSVARLDAECIRVVSAEFARLGMTFRMWQSKGNRVDPCKPHVGYPSLMGTW